MNPHEPPFTPTLEQIEERAAEIRSKWTEQERAKRMVVFDRPEAVIQQMGRLSHLRREKAHADPTV